MINWHDLMDYIDRYLAGEIDPDLDNEQAHHNHVRSRMARALQLLEQETGRGFATWQTAALAGMMRAIRLEKMSDTAPDADTLIRTFLAVDIGIEEGEDQTHPSIFDAVTRLEAHIDKALETQMTTLTRRLSSANQARAALHNLLDAINKGAGPHHRDLAAKLSSIEAALRRNHGIEPAQMQLVLEKMERLEQLLDGGISVADISADPNGVDPEEVRRIFGKKQRPRPLHVEQSRLYARMQACAPLQQAKHINEQLAERLVRATEGDVFGEQALITVTVVQLGSEKHDNHQRLGVSFRPSADDGHIDLLFWLMDTLTGEKFGPLVLSEAALDQVLLFLRTHAEYDFSSSLTD